MKGKKQFTACVFLTMCLTMTGCNGNSMYNAAKNQEKWAAEASEAAEAAAMAASEEEAELQYLTDDSDAEDYRTLAEQYAERGMIRRQRDLLEQSYRLFGLAETLEELNAIWVNLDEEATEIQEMAELMLQNLELDEYRAECLHLVEEADWFSTMMPRLQTGCRNYFKQVNGEVQLAITVGYMDEETQFSRIWYVDADGKDYYLSYDGETALLLEAEDSLTDGTFTLWSFDGLTGDIQHETGTLTGGALDTTADYKIERFEGTDKGDIYDLMNQRETVEYTELDSYGGATGNSKMSGVQALPEITVYEPVDDSEDEEDTDIQLRVCDGELQWFSEDGWVSLGTLEELAESDLFRAYTEEKTQYDESLREAQAEADPESGETQETTETEESTEESETTTTGTTTTPQTTTPAGGNDTANNTTNNNNDNNNNDNNNNDNNNDDNNNDNNDDNNNDNNDDNSNNNNDNTDNGNTVGDVSVNDIG